MGLNLSNEVHRQLIKSSKKTIDTIKKIASASSGEKLICPYSGKILTPKDTVGMAEHIIPANIDRKRLTPTKREMEDLIKYIKTLDDIIVKNPNDIGLRKYRSIIQEHTGL